MRGEAELGLGFFCLGSLSVFFIEPLDPAFSIDNFLGSRKKRMAAGADVNFQLSNRSVGLKGHATGTTYRGILICGVNTFFHKTSLTEQTISNLRRNPIVPEPHRICELAVHGL